MTITKKDLSLIKDVLNDTNRLRAESNNPVQVRDIIPVNKWVNDPYYVGQAGMSLYPYWKQKLSEIFDKSNKNTINEVIVTGGLGCHPLSYEYDFVEGRYSLKSLLFYKKKGTLPDLHILNPNTNAWASVLDVHDVGVKSCYRITISKVGTDNSDIYTDMVLQYPITVDCTNDHLVKAYKDGCLEFTKVEDLKVGDKVFFVITGVAFISSIEYLGELHSGDIEVEGHEYLDKGLWQHNTGKSTFASFCMIRKIYEMSCFTNIPALFSLMPGTTIAFMYFTVAKEQAELTGYAQIRNIIDTIPYFNEKFPRNPFVQSKIELPEHLLLLYGSSQSHCLDPESLIMTNRGMVRAIELTNRDKVWDGSSYKVVKNTYVSMGDMYRITTDSGRQLIVKDNHLNYTQRGFVETKDLKLGDLFFRVSNYRNGLSRNIEINVPKFSNDRNPLKSDRWILDKGLAEILGWLVGDGAVNKETNKNRARFYCNKDEVQVLEYFRRYLSSYIRVQAINKVSDSVYELCICSKSFNYLLNRLGMRLKSYQKRVPSVIWGSPIDIQKAFLRGLFSSDGSCKSKSKSSRNRLVSTSELLCRDVQILLNSLGYNCSVGTNGSLFSYTDSYNRKQAWQLGIRGYDNDRFYKDIGYLGVKKYQYKFQHGKDVFKYRKNTEQITKIEYLGYRMCCGAEVDGEIYTCNGVLTHNSIGMNLIGSILDEANFFQKGAQSVKKATADYSKVGEMYSAIVNRSKSRFKTFGRDDSLSILVSSNTTTSSFTDKRIRDSSDSPNTLVINTRVWDVKPRGTYSDKYFWVFIGSDLLDPYIVNDINDVYQFTDSMELPRIEGTVDKVIRSIPVSLQDRFVRVPEDFKSQYESDINTALQDISGISVSPSGRLFTSKKLYREACVPELKHPFYRDEIVISTHDTIEVKDFLSKNYMPRHKDKQRFIHIDQSTTNDSTGFASSYIDRYITDKKTGIQLPIVVTDLLLRINPPKAPNHISIAKVRNFVFYMRDILGLNIGLVTYDQFQSSDSRQILSENGINVGYLSVDRTDEQYLALCNLFYEHRIRIYDYSPAQKELFELIHYRGLHKVDHPSTGSKDVCDAWCGSVWNALQSSPTVTVSDSLGISPSKIMGVSHDSDNPFIDDEDFSRIIK